MLCRTTHSFHLTEKYHSLNALGFAIKGIKGEGEGRQLVFLRTLFNENS